MNVLLLQTLFLAPNKTKVEKQFEKMQSKTQMVLCLTSLTAYSHFKL